MNNKQRILSELNLQLNQRLKINTTHQSKKPPDRRYDGHIKHINEAIKFVENTTHDLKHFRMVSFAHNIRFITDSNFGIYICINLYFTRPPTMFADTKKGRYDFIMDYDTDIVKELDSNIDYVIFKGLL